MSKIIEKIDKYLEESEINEIKKATEVQKEIIDIFKKNKIEKIVKEWPFINDIVFSRKALMTTFKKYSKKDLVNLLKKMYKSGVKSREIDEVGAENISSIGGKEALAETIVMMINKENDYNDVLPFIKDVVSSEDYLKRSLKGRKAPELSNLVDHAKKETRLNI